MVHYINQFVLQKGNRLNEWSSTKTYHRVLLYHDGINSVSFINIRSTVYQLT